MRHCNHSVIAVAAFAVAAMSAYAQQTIREVQPVVSPVVNADNTVTFRFAAPTAESVQVTGDFLPVQTVPTPDGMSDIPGVADLVRNGNVWEYTTTALEPELYSYSFIVDGVRMNDPANVYRLRDIGTITDIFLVAGDRNVSGNKWVYAVGDVPHGTVSKVWYHSATFGTDRRMTVYTPAAYSDTTRRFPVLYLLHGMGGDENAWSELGCATRILDNMIADGSVEPMIVVMPNGNADLQAAPGESCIGFVPPTTALPRTMDGSFISSFPEIVEYVDAAYRTQACKSERAIAGLSMGGFHSKFISAQYPDMFDYVGLFSAAYSPRADVKSEVFENVDAKVAAQFALHPKLYWIGIGSDDFLYEDNLIYRKFLTDKGYPFVYIETPGGHIWRNWRVYLTDFLPRLFKSAKD